MQFSRAQSDSIDIIGSIDKILKIYYSHIFIDSCHTSLVKSLPNKIEIESWNYTDSAIVRDKTIVYDPKIFYSTLKFKNRIYSESEKIDLQNYLGESFTILNPTGKIKDLEIFPTDSTALRFKEITHSSDIKYRVNYTKEHGIFFNLTSKWVFESDFTTSFIVFEKNHTLASVRINLVDLTKGGWAYFEKEGEDWRLVKVRVLENFAD